jgi:hypothetical protein
MNMFERFNEAFAAAEKGDIVGRQSVLGVILTDYERALKEAFCHVARLNHLGIEAPWIRIHDEKTKQDLGRIRLEHR